MRFAILLIFLTQAADLAADARDIHYVGTLQSEVKDAPSGDSETKFIIALGRKVMEFETRGDWVWVGIDRTGGKDGWVQKEDLSPIDPDGLRD